MSAGFGQSSAGSRAGFEWFSPCDTRVAGALRKRFEGASSPGELVTTASGFSLDLSIGDVPHALAVQVFTEDGWMIWDAALETGSGKLTARQLLEASAGLPGGVKVVWRTDPGGDFPTPRPVLRAELPLGPGLDVEVVVEEVLGGLVEGARRVAKCTTQPAASAGYGLPVSAGIARDPSSQHDTESYSRALRDAGWTTSSREDGRVFVDLEVRAGYRQALLESGPAGELRLSCVLPQSALPASNACAEALSIAALRTGSWVRMVRAVHDGALRLEVPLGPGLGPDSAGSASAALSVAQQLLGDEAEVLSRDHAVASQYLSRCTHAPGSERRKARGRPRGPKPELD